MRGIRHPFPGCLPARSLDYSNAYSFGRRTKRPSLVWNRNNGIGTVYKSNPFHPFRPTRSFSSDTSTSSGGFAGCASVAAPFARLLRQCAVRRRSRTTCYCVVWTPAPSGTLRTILRAPSTPLYPPAIRSAKICTNSPHCECLVTVLSEHAFVSFCLSLENSAKRLDTVRSRTRVDSLPIATGTFRR